MVLTCLGLCTRQIHVARQTDCPGNYLAHGHAQWYQGSTSFRGIHTYSATIRIGEFCCEITRKFSFLTKEKDVSEFILFIFKLRQIYLVLYR
jgi:hypothetical protein